MRTGSEGGEAGSLDIRPIGEADLDAVLEVYHQCEDFLALGPNPHASPDMVQADLELSRSEGGVFYGVYDGQGTMVGIVDFVPGAFEGDPRHAFLSLLMIAAPYRSRGLGRAVVEWVEGEVRKDPAVCSILSGVQVTTWRRSASGRGWVTGSWAGLRIAPTGRLCTACGRGSRFTAKGAKNAKNEQGHSAFLASFAVRKAVLMPTRQVGL